MINLKASMYVTLVRAENKVGENGAGNVEVIKGKDKEAMEFFIVIFIWASLSEK